MKIDELHATHMEKCVTVFTPAQMTLIYDDFLK
jgi:hypothetical protein